MATTDENGRYSKVRLILHVPKGRRVQMRKLLKPLLKPVDRFSGFVHVDENEIPTMGVDPKASGDTPKYQVGQEMLSSPAVTLMVFLPENKLLEEAKSHLHSFPWKFHHRIELTKLQSPGVVAATQEFYSLSRKYPLCSPCPSYSGNLCILRFSIFVKNFRKMLEFYRLLTDSEMESSKPDFAVFVVNTSDPKFAVSSSFSSSSSKPSSSSSQTTSYPWCVQLALKHCPHLDPFPPTSAYLTVLVRNMTALRTVLPGHVTEISPNSYIVRDPDGNSLLVHDVEPAYVIQKDSLCHNQGMVSKTGRSEHAPKPAQPGLCSSKDSYCESQDSGRFSDSERGSSERSSTELERRMERLVRAVNLHITESSESSDTESEREMELNDSGACVGDNCSDCDSSKTKVKIAPLNSICVSGKPIAYL